MILGPSFAIDTSVRVLILTSTFPAAEGDPVPLFVKDQAVALKAAYPHLDITILAPHVASADTAGFKRHLQFDEYRFHYLWPRRWERLTGSGILPTLRRNPLYYLAIPPLLIGCLVATIQLIRKRKIDMIYAHWFTPQAIVAWAAQKLTSCPFVYTSHSSDVAVLRKVPLLGALLVRKVSREARGISVVSRRSLEKLRRFFHEGDWESVSRKVEIIPMGVHLPATDAVQFDAPKHAPIFFIGRLVEKKGVQVLLPAYARLLQDMGNPPPLVIAGDGPWRERLERTAADLGLPKERVLFPGFLAGAEKQEALKQSGIVVVPSIVAADGDAEGLPVALLEGLAAGKVCVATRESGADDILASGENGFLVEGGSVGKLAEAMREALTLDEAERRSIAKRARETANLYSWPLVAERHYHHLLAAR